MFYEELKQIIRLVLQQGLSGQALMDALTADVNRLKWSGIDGRINSRCQSNGNICIG